MGFIYMFTRCGALILAVVLFAGCSLTVNLPQSPEPDMLVIERKGADISPHPHYFAGIILLERREFLRAAEAFRKALSIQPDFAEAHIGLGHAFRNMGRYRRAEVAYNRALELEPLNSQACIGLSKTHLLMGKYTLARNDLEPIVADEHCRYDVHRLRAYAFYFEGDYAAAVTEITKALQCTPLKEDDSILARIHNDLVQYINKYSPE